MQSRRHFKVFLCSPNDVTDERASAVKVIEQLQYDPWLRDQVTLESVSWDKLGSAMPLSARMTPQEAIRQGMPKPSDCDVVVVILWARMGTPLPDKFRKPDGSRYLSGTEWEFEDALHSSRNPKPEILVYRCTKNALADMDDPDLEEKLAQKAHVNTFFQAFLNPDGSILRGYNEYKTPEDFRSKLEQHLRSTLKGLVTMLPANTAFSPASGNEVLNVGIQWNRSPFPGLRAFTPEDAPIFFGRGRETDDLVSRFHDPECRFIVVLGDSGSGKSSLIGAGLLPRLQDNAIPGSRDWRRLRFAPGEGRDDPFIAFAMQVSPMLNESERQNPRELARKLNAHPEEIKEITKLVLSSFPQWAELLLFIDQFEELFTTTDERFRGPFIHMLKEAHSLRNIRIVASMRVDFYQECTKWPELVELFQTGSYVLSPPGPGALYEMITRPADRAGLYFEEGLAQRIVDDAGANPGALALMAYALDELYQVCKGDKHLTHRAYEALGELQGAIGTRAESIFETLDKEARESLPKVFRELVQLDTRGNVTRFRADFSNIGRTGGMGRIVDALTAARLLVKSRSDSDRSTVEVAHEALFTVWPRFETWINENLEFLVWRQRLQATLTEWEFSRRDDEALLRGVRASEAERWFLDREEDLNETEKNFIRASVSKWKALIGEKDRLTSQIIPEPIREKQHTDMRSRRGLRRKLILTILLVGALPLTIGLVMAYLQGTKQIREISGTSFEALATETARKIDLILSEELSSTSQITTDVNIIKGVEAHRDQLLAYNDEALQALIAQETQLWNEGNPEFVQPLTQNELVTSLRQYYGGTYVDPGHPIPVITRSATRALFITDVAGRVVASLNTQVPYAHSQESWWIGAFKNGIGHPYIENVAFNEPLGTYTFTLSLPIMDSIRYQVVGVLHRVYDAKEFFTSSIDTIRFGKTGHVMLIDGHGMVLSCPILPTGTSLSDPSLIPLVTPMRNGWTAAPNDGHGGVRSSIIGFAPLPTTSRITQSSTGMGWHMFVWQSADELFAPIEHLFTWIAVFGLLSVALLATLGAIAAGRIVAPIRQLQEAARLIGLQKLEEPIIVKTEDELEELAWEMNQMNEKLKIAFSELMKQIELKAQQFDYFLKSTIRILDAMPNPVILFDRDERLYYINKSCKTSLGEAAQGTNILDFIKADAATKEQLRNEVKDLIAIKDPLIMVPGESEILVQRRFFQYEWFILKAESEGDSTYYEKLGLMLSELTGKSLGSKERL